MSKTAKSFKEIVEAIEQDVLSEVTNHSVIGIDAILDEAREKIIGVFKKGTLDRLNKALDKELEGKSLDDLRSLIGIAVGMNVAFVTREMLEEAEAEGLDTVICKSSITVN
jgi:hypothetical protein